MNTNTLARLYNKYKQNGIETILSGGIAASYKIDLVSRLPILLITKSITAITKGEHMRILTS
jgi:diphthamide synthase (EF-2-diphthine--ammonia ligase)